MSDKKHRSIFLHILMAGDSLIQAAVGGLDGHCPPLGPVLPAPTSPSSSSPVQSAVSGLADYFTNITSPFVGSAVSISVSSIHEDGKLVDLHYTPPSRGAGSTAEVDGDTIYRIGSVSKAFTALGVLKAGIRMDDPVTLYLPELRDLGAADGVNSDITAVNWDDITIGALASHMSGIGAECNYPPPSQLLDLLSARVLSTLPMSIEC